MSARGRTPESGTDPCEVFGTPAWCVYRLLERVHLPRGLWLEPAAGDGNIIRAVDSALPADEVRWHAIEVREECHAALRAIPSVDLVGGGAFLGYNCTFPWMYDVIITNPPFRQATEFVRHALEFSRVVVMLLRLNWLSGEKRSSWLSHHIPDVYVLPNRPSFSADGRTDATDYAWCLFHAEGVERTYGRLEILETTPASIRRRAYLEDARPRRGQLGLPLANLAPRAPTGAGSGA